MIWGCAQYGSRFGLLLEKRGGFFRQQGFGKDFDGNLTLEGLLEGHEHGRHGAVPQLLQQYGGAHLPADQMIQIEFSRWLTWFLHPDAVYDCSAPAAAALYNPVFA